MCNKMTADMKDKDVLFHMEDSDYSKVEMLSIDESGEQVQSNAAVNKAVKIKQMAGDSFVRMPTFMDIDQLPLNGEDVTEDSDTIGDGLILQTGKRNPRDNPKLEGLTGDTP